MRTFNNTQHIHPHTHLSEIWPRVRQALGPSVTFSLVGADWDLLGPMVTEAAGVKITGFLEQGAMESELLSVSLQNKRF